MSEFFGQLLVQLKDIWTRFTSQQKIMLVTVFVATFVGILLVVSVTSFGGGGESKYATLYANMETPDAADITGFLKENKFEYSLDDDGRTILVPKEQVHEVRMALARSGLPRQQGKGYELFDKNQLGMTDFAQNLNYRRAVETELIRSIETFREVEKARVHITIPKATIFMEKKEEPSAAVIVKIRPGAELNERQIKGITHLVASAVEGLVARQVQVLDDHGTLLTKGFADNAVAENTSHNMEMKRSVEKHLEQQIMSILDGVLGPDKARVTVSADLDFDQINKTVETYDPTKKVVRSEQRDDASRKDSPTVGDEVKEGSITNYEINRTLASIVASPGATRRLSVSVAVDGLWETGSDKKRVFKPRSPDELKILDQLVRNAVGFSQERGDNVYVAAVQFDRSMIQEEVQALEKASDREFFETWALRASLVLIIILAFFFLRRIAQGLVEAMNPPVPKYAGIDLDVEEEQVPDTVRRHNELVEKLEEFTATNPGSVANLLRIWLAEGGETTERKKSK